ncbi:MAG TPA: methyltransferase [Chitinophagaceae bacterium]|nr:methyltransferase [Chitinophagaceae bacterium]
MPNSYFQFKQFTIHQDRCAMKVTTDACLFGAWVAEEVRSQESGVGSSLDIGTGTGLLALMLAQKNPEMKIEAIEINKEAAEQAKINAGSSPWKEQINILQADVKGFSFEKEFDLIISNPPFYENEIRSASDSKNVAHHSDNLTLKELLVIIKNNLSKTGIFFLLLPYKRNEEIKKLLKDHELNISKILFVRQSVKHDYFRIMLKGKLGDQENIETEFNEMSIWDDDQQYTTEFKQLLKNYYLHL